MSGDPVRLALAADDEVCRAVAAASFPGVPLEVLSREDLRPSVPFAGRLFALTGAVPGGSVVGLVAPVYAVTGIEAADGHSGERFDAGAVVAIADHVNLEPCGPLTGRWPAGVPRGFPVMTAIYQPVRARPHHRARVYSSGVVAAGVADARDLTPFESRALREGGWPVVSDCLVPVAVVAAYHGLKLAAYGVVRAPRFERE